MFWKLLATEFSLSQYHLCIPSFSFAYLFSTSKTSKASSCGFGVYKTVKTIFTMVLSSRLVGDKDEMQWMQFLECCGRNEIGVRREVKRAWIVNKCVKRTKQKLRCKMDGIFWRENKIKSEEGEWTGKITMRYERFICFGIPFSGGVLLMLSSFKPQRIIFNNPFLQHGELYTCHFR